jgi:hypothetical protein
MSARKSEIEEMVRKQVGNAIRDDLDGGEMLMKEVWERLKNYEEEQIAHAEMRRILALLEGGQPAFAEANHAGAAVAARIFCPTCRKIHVDRGVGATKPHSTHLCEHCGALWCTPTVGIEAGTPKLYEIDDGGARHWVAAHSPARAKQVWVDAIGEAPEEWVTEPPEVTEVDRKKMATLTFTFEDGTKTAMANVFDLYDDEGIVATTEH